MGYYSDVVINMTKGTWEKQVPEEVKKEILDLCSGGGILVRRDTKLDTLEQDTDYYSFHMEQVKWYVCHGEYYKYIRLINDFIRDHNRMIDENKENISTDNYYIGFARIGEEHDDYEENWYFDLFHVYLVRRFDFEDMDKEIKEVEL